MLIYILIDDDKLIHMLWEMEAKKYGITIKCFLSVRDFLLKATQYSSDSEIYIDSDLGNGLRGEIESEKIFRLGFTNLHLATGYSPEDIEKPSWIKSIQGKRPEFKVK